MRTIKQKRKGRNIALYVVFVLLAVVLLFPYFFMINRGLMSNEFILQPKTRFSPTDCISKITVSHSARAATVNRF